MDPARGSDDLHHPTAAQSRWVQRLGGLGLPQLGYVLGVAAVATWGFATDSTVGILLAVLLTVPIGVLALIGYYLVYGLVAQVPGANPRSGSGSAWCSPGGVCQESSTGNPAAWFTYSMDAVGVLALFGAAVMNVLLLRAVLARRRERG